MQYGNVNAEQQTKRAKRGLPTRADGLKALQTGENFDVLIIGGGATGAGCALDSVTRGNENPNYKPTLSKLAIFCRP